MKKFLIGFLIVLGLVPVVRIGLLHAISEVKLRDYERPTPFRRYLPTEVSALENGRRLVVTRGCRGCHGDDLSGAVMPWAGRAVAVNLTRYVREHDLATLEAAVRHGIGADGKSLVSMPSFMFHALSDEDFLDLAAYLNSLDVIEDDLPKPFLSREARRALKEGEKLHMAAFVKHLPKLRHQGEVDTPLARGEYLAMTACSECHGLDLRGWIEDGWSAPDLAIAAAYTPADFQTLMHEGKALGNRELKMMSGVARSRFSKFTDEERTALHAYLRTLASRPVPGNVIWRVH